MSNEKLEKACSEHDWVESPYVLTSNPTQTKAICRLCGKITYFRNYIQSQKESYEEVYKKFHGEAGKTD